MENQFAYANFVNDTVKNRPVFVCTSSSSLETRGRDRDWHFIYSRDYVTPSKLGWGNATSILPVTGANKFDFAEFFREPREEGYYYFKVGSATKRPPLFPVYIGGIKDFSVLKRVREGESTRYDVLLDLMLHLMSREDEPEVRFRVIPSGARVWISRNGAPVFPNAAGFINLSLNDMRDTLPIFIHEEEGEAEVEVKYLGSTRRLRLFPIISHDDSLILVNANDSNNDGYEDYRNLFPVAVPDPELVRFDLLKIARQRRGPGNPVRVILHIPRGLNAYGDQSKAPLPALPVSINPGYVSYELEPVPETIYLEGVTPSERPKDTGVLVDLAYEDGMISSEWNFTVLHLLLNRAMRPGYYQSDNGLLVPRVKNPAIIAPLIPMGSGENPYALASLFELESFNMSVLQEYQERIEWTVYTPEGENVVEYVPKPDVADTRFGTWIELYSKGEGAVDIGVRLRGTAADYIYFRTWAKPLKYIPVSFQFFTNDAMRLQAERVAGRIPEILFQMNMLARQGSIAFKFAPQENHTNFYEQLIFEIRPSNDRRYPLPYLALAGNPGDYFPNGEFAIRYSLGSEEQRWSGNIVQFLFDESLGRSFVRFSSPPDFPVFYPGRIVPDIPPPNPDFWFPGVVFHANCPDWVVGGGGSWPYTMAISSVKQAVSFNFVSPGQDGPKRMGAISSYPDPFMLGLNSPEGPALLLTFNPTMHKFPFLVPKPGERDFKLAAAAIPLPVSDPENPDFFGQELVKELVATAFATLGMKEHTLEGDLEGYRDEGLLRGAVSQNVLLKRGEELFINPISPPTDNSLVMHVRDNIMTKTGDERGYRIDVYQAMFLYDHPLLVE